MPLNRSSSGLVGASLIVIIIEPDKHFIRTVGSFVDADSRSAGKIELHNISYIRIYSSSDGKWFCQFSIVTTFRKSFLFKCGFQIG